MEHTKRRTRPQKGANRVLVVEGEDLIRQFTGRTLGELGYSVSTAAGSAEAIGYFRVALETGKPYAAVILALETSDSGEALDTLEQLRLMDPKVQAIVTSTDPSDPVLSEYRRYGFRSSLVKPYSEIELAAVLEKGLQAD